MTSLPSDGGLVLPPLLPGRLIRRYQRFFADVRLDTGELVTAHCPNTGAMTACSQPGWPVYLSRQPNPRRKLKYTWELTRTPESLAGVNTLTPNRLVRRAIGAGILETFREYTDIRAEAAVGRHRLDLMLSGKKGRCYIEIKNCSLVTGRTAWFPDAVTSRGLAHLRLLQELSASGHRTVMFFLVNRMDATVFRPAAHIDPAYAAELEQAAVNGVEILCYDVAIALKEAGETGENRISLRHPLPVALGDDIGPISPI